MTSSFAPPAGDPGRLRAQGYSLGRTAAGVADHVARVRRGTQLVELALLASSSALRIDELRKGMRGLDHELSVVRSAGEQVADIVHERAAALDRLRDDLASLSDSAHQHPDQLPALQAQADALRADHRHADQRAGEAIARVTAALTAHAAPAPVSRSVLSGAHVTLDDAWLAVDGAYESIAEREFRKDQRTVLYQSLGFADGFGGGLDGTLTGVRDLVRHPLDAGHGFVSFIHAAVTDPDGTARSVWHRTVDPYTDDWRNHEYGHAAGRGVEALVEVLVGAKGATKVGKLCGEALASRGAATITHVWTSPDPHVGEIANWIDRERPGSVKHVNSWVPMRDGGLREVDIDLGTSVVQVKSNHARRLLAQVQETEATTRRPVIAYAPSMPHGAYAHALREGFAVARTKEDLLNLIRELE